MNDSDYNGQGTSQFVSIWGTYGIDFTNCTFEFDYDNAAFPTQLTVDKWPTGINSASGGYRLKDDNGNGCDFINLQNGIHSYAYWGLRDRIFSEHTTFTNVYRNAYIAGNRFPLMRDGDHDIPEWNYSLDVPAYGFMGNWNYGYRLYDNTYDPKTAGDQNQGVVINGTVFPENFVGGRVFDNTFTGMYVGTQTEENNLYAQISCNTYDDGYIDWAVNPLTEGYLADQGTDCPSPVPGATDGTRAGNTFIDNLADFNVYDFNLQDQSVYYAAGGSNNNTIPSNSSLSILNVENCFMSQTDPTCTASGGGVIYWDSRRHASHQTWHGRLADLDSLEAHIDSSETQLLLDTIANLKDRS